MRNKFSGIDQFSNAHWESLRYFNLYRFCIAGFLFASSILHPSLFSVIAADNGKFHLALTSLYLLTTTGALIGLHYYHRRFNMQLTVHVLVDILVLTLLIHSGGGLRSGLGVMLLVTLTGAGLVGQGRLVLFYAAAATLFILFEQSYRAFLEDFEMVDFFQAGMFCAGFFGVAISARLLARRIIANEELAKKRGIDLRNQTLINQRAIEEMQDGVLVIDRNGRVKQHNPRAEHLLGISFPANDKLENHSPELQMRFSAWRNRPNGDPVTFRTHPGGILLRARFIATESTERDVLILLDDMERLQEQARQLKLAALGRLTANIAHEIRNPLSAINHAGELLQEESHSGTQERLLKIMLDNTQRVERIVSDVLELGRRDRAHRETLDLRQLLPALVEEFTSKGESASLRVEMEISGTATIFFDKPHFHQVLWNLIGNAMRHSQGITSFVRLLVVDGSHEGIVNIHVIDDGPGIEAKRHEQVFEPFFTTHSSGTGLGLYIARELCEANGAQLQLLHSQSGADFCISGRSTG